MKAFFGELRRRRVWRTLALYFGAAWLLIQIATQVFPFFDVPNAAVRWVVIASLACAPLAAVLSWFYEFTTAGVKRQSELDCSDTPPKSRSLIALGRNGVIVLSIGATALLADALIRHWMQKDGAPELSIAVLPFKTYDEGRDDAWFTDGIQDEIQARLSKIAGLQVMAPASVKRYAGSDSDLHEIAEQLQVSHIVEGSVRRSGASARIIVRLTATASGTQIWGETYDRRLANIFDVESEVAKAIVDALRTRLTPVEKRELAADPTRNAQAYEAYLRGMAVNARVLQADTLAETAQWFGRAAELDPGFALAWARLARVNANRAYYGFDLTEHPCEQARHAAETAWRLAPDLGETDLARGYVRMMCDNDLRGATQAFEHARTRLPNDVDVLRAISQIKWQLGDWAAVLPYLQQALELDPRNPELLSTYALYLGANRRLSEARDAIGRATLLDPTDETLKASAAAIEQADGRLDAAQAQLAGVALRPATAEVFDYQMLQLIYRGQHAQASAALTAALASEGAALGISAGDYYFLLATAEGALGRHDAMRQAYARGYQALKPFDNSGLAANSSGDVYLQGMLCLMAVGSGTGTLAADCEATRRVARADGQLSLVALEMLAQAELLAGDHKAAATDVLTLLSKPYLSNRYKMPLTPALLARDPIWAPLRGDARLRKLQ